MQEYNGIAFDCYGTLLEIVRPRGVTRRYAMLARTGRGPSPLVQDVGLSEALLARGVDTDVCATIARDAQQEADSVQPLPGALETVDRLKRAGIALVVASNLSREYAAPLRHALPDVPLLLSFEIGHAKPAAAMYAAIRNRLGGGRMLMVGDSRRCDYDGARMFGMDAVLIGDTEDGDTTISGVDRLLHHLGMERD